MNLIFIYGPPASGKLTIATELAKLSGYPLFHNHLTRDLVLSLYPDSLTENYYLVNKLRLDILEYCTRQGTDLIFTFVYDGPEDNAVVSKLMASVTNHGGKVLLVELMAPDSILLDRVSNSSRTLHKKLVEPEVLRVLLKDKAYSSVPYPDILKMDTSQLDPATAANTIFEHYKLG